MQTLIRFSNFGRDKVDFRPITSFKNLEMENPPASLPSEAVAYARQVS